MSLQTRTDPSPRLPFTLSPFLASPFTDFLLSSFHKPKHLLRARMNADKLKNLQIDPNHKGRRQGSPWIIFLAVIVISAIAVYLAWPKAGDDQRFLKDGPKAATSSRAGGTGAASTSGANSPDNVLTVSGYIINRERIELSPRYMGVVNWIGVKKGDAVTNGQIVVLLDDAEYKARVMEAGGRVDSVKTALARAELDLERINQLARTDIESKKTVDDARLQVEAARADLKQAEGAYALAQTYLDWTVIRSPINGVVLEKLVDPNELVVPQSFGGTRGPSTALIALADPKDLQVEIDMNEADLSKISLNQKCRVSPEAYPDKTYEGVVAEVAPEANRSKGTLQIKVQVINPDRFLTPELNAKVEFLKQ
jgi:HlyD family secretion protein